MFFKGDEGLLRCDAFGSVVYPSGTKWFNFSYSIPFLDDDRFQARNLERRG